MSLDKKLTTARCAEDQIKINRLIDFIKNSEESEKDLCNLLIECKHKIEKLEKENEELKAMLKSISDVSMGKIKFDIDNLLNRTILTNAINNVKLGG